MKTHEREIKICHTTLKILKFSLIWPSEEEEMHPSKWYYIRISTFLAITSLWVLSVFMRFIIAIKNNVDVYVSENVGFMCAICGVYYMTSTFVKNQSKTALLLRDLSNFEKFGKPPGFDEEQKKLSFWSKCCFYYTVFGITGYTFIKLLGKAECDRISRQKEVLEICGMMSPIWIPFDINYFPVYHIVALYVFISLQIFLKLVLMISYNCLEMAHHVILRINHLNMMLEECFDDEDIAVTREKLKSCILYHLEILDLSSRLDDCFSNGMFGHLTMTAAICGCLEKQFIDNDSRIGAVIHICGWIMALFVSCMGGQHLIDAGDSLTEAIWSSKWYQANVELKKDFLFMLTRSQKSLHVSVGSFSILSFSLLVSVLKMSYSIFAMLSK